MKIAKLIIDKNGVTTFTVKGKTQLCPFIPPLVLGGKLGGVEVMKTPCSSDCPLYEEIDEVLNISCGGDLVSIIIDRTEESPAPLTSNLLKL